MAFTHEQIEIIKFAIMNAIEDWESFYNWIKKTGATVENFADAVIDDLVTISIEKANKKQ